MTPWNGNIRELLSEEQLKAIEDSLAGVPESLCVDKRGMRLNRYPGLLSDPAREGVSFNVIASERPVTERGLVLISNAPIPEIEAAMLVIRTDEKFQQRFQGHAQPSRLGQRPEDHDTKTPFHYSVFQPNETTLR